MPVTNFRNIASIFLPTVLSMLLCSPFATAQEDESATREHQAAQLRLAVDSRISQLDDEYTVRATDLRRQFNDRRRELEANADSEIELSNAMAAIGRVYQDSLAALQREINARKDGVYTAQSQANDELTRQGAISAGTWSRISSTPIEEIPTRPAPAVSVAEVEPVIAEEEAPQAEPAPVIAEEETPDEDTADAGAILAIEQTQQPSGCEIRWFPDRDRDLFGDAGSAATLACYPGKPAGFVDNDYDCDDSDPTVNPITGSCRPE